MVKDCLNRRFTNPQTPLPTNGPTSQPAAPHAAVAIPSTMNGSRPITWAPSDSRSCVERNCTPTTVLAREVATDEASE